MRQLNDKQLQKMHHNFKSNYVFIHINKCAGGAIEAALGLKRLHMTAEEYINVLGREKWDNTFSFSFVRNPWDKVVSHYHYRVATNQTELGENSMDFNEWVRLSYEENDPYYYDQPLMFMPQIQWLTDNEGKIVANHIGRFENLQLDFDEVCTKIGVKPPPLPHVRKTVRGNYKEYYNPKTREIIAKWFAQDIEEFGYSF